MTREPPDCIGNESTLDIHIKDSGEDIKIQNDKYMPFVINMLIMETCSLPKYTTGGQNLTNYT